jgi:hypothetical protein
MLTKPPLIPSAQRTVTLSDVNLHNYTDLPAAILNIINDLRYSLGIHTLENAEDFNLKILRDPIRQCTHFTAWREEERVKTK